MRWLRQGLTLLLAVGAVAAGGLFSLQNTKEIPLDLMVVQLPAQPVAIWVSTVSSFTDNASVKASTASSSSPSSRKLKPR